MSYFTDNEKLLLIKRAFVDKIESMDTLVALKNLIDNMTPAKVKNFIKNVLQARADGLRNLVSNTTDQADAIENEIITGL